MEFDFVLLQHNDEIILLKIVQVVGNFLNSSSEKQQSQKAKSKWSSVCLKVKKNDFQFSALISCSGYILTSVNTQAHAGFSTIDLPFQSRRGIFSVPPWLEHELIHWQCWDSPVRGYKQQEVSNITINTKSFYSPTCIS